MKKEQLEALYLKAQDETASKEELTEIWYSTKSLKIRKAIASNCNAEPAVLKMAARLYLEEVLVNPGFEMLRLFDSDPWVNKIAEAYENPNEFFVKYGKYSSVGLIGGELYARAILLSKSLTAEALNCCVSVGPKSALDRALKNKDVFQNIQLLVQQSFEGETYSPFELESLLILYKRQVVDKQLLFKALSSFGAASSSARKRIYTDFYSGIIHDYSLCKDKTEQKFLVNLLTKFVSISRAHTLHWLDYWQIPNKKVFVDIVARVYKNMLEFPQRSILKEHQRVLSNSLWSFVRSDFLSSNQQTNDFEKIYDFFEDYGLADGITESKAGFNMRNARWIEQIEKASIETKIFLTKSFCLGDWAAISDSDNRYKIFEEVNNYLEKKYGVGDKLLYRCCSLRKIISVNDSVHTY